MTDKLSYIVFFPLRKWEPIRTKQALCDQERWVGEVANGETKRAKTHKSNQKFNAQLMNKKYNKNTRKKDSKKGKENGNSTKRKQWR